MARTDALATEGIDAAIARARAYVDAGAEMLFPQDCTELSHYERFTESLPDVPILANLDEFGPTPLFSAEELSEVGVSMALYPLSAHRVQSKMALKVYETILRDGHQRSIVDKMQSKDDSNETLNWHKYEGFLERVCTKE